MKTCGKNRRAAEKFHPEITVKYQEKVNLLWDEANDFLVDLCEKSQEFKSEKKSIQENGNHSLYTDEENSEEENDIYKTTFFYFTDFVF